MHGYYIVFVSDISLMIKGGELSLFYGECDSTCIGIRIDKQGDTAGEYILILLRRMNGANEKNLIERCAEP